MSKYLLVYIHKDKVYDNIIGYWLNSSIRETNLDIICFLQHFINYFKKKKLKKYVSVLVYYVT